MSFVSVVRPEGSYVSSYLLRKFAEEIPGGLAEGEPDSKYPKTQLRMGTKVEKEHTGDKAKAKEIAKDHLEEDKKYYTKLKKIEGGSHKTASIYILKGFEKKAFEMEKEAKFGTFLRAAGGVLGRGAVAGGKSGVRFARNTMLPAVQRAAKYTRDTVLPAAVKYTKETAVPAAVRGAGHVKQYVQNQVYPRIQSGVSQATEFAKTKVAPAVQSRVQQAQDYMKTTGIPKAQEKGTNLKQYAQRLWNEKINPTRSQQFFNDVKDKFRPEGTFERVNRGIKERIKNFRKSRAEKRFQKRVDKEVNKRMSEKNKPTTTNTTAEAPKGAVGEWWGGLTPIQKAMVAGGGGIGAGMLLSGGGSQQSRPPSYAY